MRTPGFLRSEDGATAVVFAVSLLMLLAVSALAIDLGSAWQTKRDLVTDTDAAALAAARHLEGLSPAAHALECVAASNDLTEDTTDTHGEAEDYLDSNRNASVVSDPTYEFADFDVSCDGAGRTGRVTVAAARDARLTFAGIVGVNSIHPKSTAVAQYGDIVALTGLRPFGLCFGSTPATKDPHVAAFTAAVNGSGDPATDGGYQALNDGDALNPRDRYPLGTGDGRVDYPENSSGADYPTVTRSYPTGGPVVYRVYFESLPNNTPHPGCGGGAGNAYYGVFCFESNLCDSNDLEDLLANGYDGVVNIDHPSCQPDGTAHCEGKTGLDLFSSSAKTAWEKIISEEIQLTIPLYSGVTSSGNNNGNGNNGNGNNNSPSGTNVAYTPSGFLGAVARAVRLAGNNQNNTSWVDLEFVTIQQSGKVGQAPGGTSTGVRGVQLCGNDAVTTGLADNCDVG